MTEVALITLCIMAGLALAAFVIRKFAELDRRLQKIESAAALAEDRRIRQLLQERRFSHLTESIPSRKVSGIAAE
jgi:hypothetical protein